MGSGQSSHAPKAKRPTCPGSWLGPSRHTGNTAERTGAPKCICRECGREYTLHRGHPRKHPVPANRFGNPGECWDEE